MTSDPHSLSGAYVLDALPGEEAEEFRRHLHTCTACREEVGRLRAVAADLGAARPLQPPVHLRARILTAVQRTPQTPAGVVPPELPTEETAEEPSDIRMGHHRPAPPDAAPAPVVPLRSRTSPRTWLAAAAAAVVVVGAAIGVRAVLDDPDQPALAPPVASVFRAGDAETATVRTANGGKLTVGVSRSRHEMAVDTRDLPPLDSRHVYQIWAVHDGRTASAALLEDPEAGAAMALPKPGTTVALTVEPEGGSPRPTTDPIAQVDPGAV